MKGGLRRLALRLEYQGTNYSGFQIQPGLRTIQGALQDALHGLMEEHIKTDSAGRTDTGTHAVGQVVAFTSTCSYSPNSIIKALNKRLPSDIRVTFAVDVGLGFDPRRHAESREYRYLILNSDEPSAFWGNFSHRVPEHLNVSAMNKAGRMLVGSHTIPPFALVRNWAGLGVCQRIFESEITRTGSMVMLVVKATAFFPHQIRRIMAALVGIGKGGLGINWFQGIVFGRGTAAITGLPACGLYLVNVSYPMVPALNSENVEKRLIPWLL